MTYLPAGKEPLRIGAVAAAEHAIGIGPGAAAGHVEGRGKSAASSASPFAVERLAGLAGLILAPLATAPAEGAFLLAW